MAVQPKVRIILKEREFWLLFGNANIPQRQFGLDLPCRFLGKLFVPAKLLRFPFPLVVIEDPPHPRSQGFSLTFTPMLFHPPLLFAFLEPSACTSPAAWLILSGTTGSS
jgi:hypothetical protein